MNYLRNSLVVAKLPGLFFRPWSQLQVILGKSVQKSRLFGVHLGGVGDLRFCLALLRLDGFFVRG
ncbi:MAG: hypothetical protein NT168_00215 [Planctomycetota bacterium]|nr:hypothetical protein [Planctomycetota bacterium]